MKRYMDREGYRIAETPPRQSSRDIRRAERWIEAIMARGASVPEAAWELGCVFSAAVENVRCRRVQAVKR